MVHGARKLSSMIKMHKRTFRPSSALFGPRMVVFAWGLKMPVCMGFVAVQLTGVPSSLVEYVRDSYI